MLLSAYSFDLNSIGRDIKQLTSVKAKATVDMADLHRLQTHDLELGATEAVQKHMSRHVVAAKPVSQRKLDFEHRRPRILRECMAEATGVFFYV